MNKEEILSIIRTLRAELEPIYGHDDKGAIEDCWMDIIDFIEGKFQLEKTITRCLKCDYKGD